MNQALLVGINEYKSSRIRNLKGCRNDVENVSSLLKLMLGNDIEITCLQDSAATRENIISGFRNNLCLAEKGELAIFYFSGHGSLEPSHPAFFQFQDDEEHENIVPYDSIEDAHDIADKEIQVLIRELGEVERKIVLIFDCCHAGSGHRGRFENIRSAGSKDKYRPIEKYLDGVLDIFDRNYPSQIQLAACSREQLSRELKLGLENKPQGIFTYSLIEIAREGFQPGFMSYNNLIAVVNNRISTILQLKNKQNPRLEALGGFDSNQYFLQWKSDSRRQEHYSLFFDKDGHWKVNIGQIHGLNNQEISKFGIYKDPELSQFFGEIITEKVGLTESTVSLPSGFNPLPAQIFYIPATSLSLKRIGFWVSKEDKPILENFYDALVDAKDPKSELIYGKITKQLISSTIFFTQDATSVRYGIVVDDIGIKFIYSESGEEIVKNSWIKFNKNKLGEEEINLFFRAILHISKWERLRTIDGGDLNTEGIKISFKDEKANTFINQEYITIDYIEPFHFELKIQNRSYSDLDSICYYLSRNFESEQVEHLFLESLGEEKYLDGNGDAVLEIPSNEPYLNQITERYVNLLSSKKLPFLSLENSVSIKEILFEDDFLSKRERRKTDEDCIDSWGVERINIKLLKQLSILGNYDSTISLDQGELTFLRNSNVKAKVGITSSADWMDGPPSDRYMKRYLKNLGLGVFDFSSSKKLETIIELSEIGYVKEFESEPLEFLIKLKEALPDTYFIALTLPEEFPSNVSNEDLNKRENLNFGLPIVCRLEKLDTYTYSGAIHRLFKNPDDGRALKGKSLKISLLQIKAEKISHLNSLIQKGPDNQAYLVG